MSCGGAVELPTVPFGGGWRAPTISLDGGDVSEGDVNSSVCMYGGGWW